MDIGKIAIVGITGTFMALTIKKNSPEFSLTVAMITGIIILFMVIEKLGECISVLKDIYSKTGLDFVYIEIVMKVIGVAYISEFAVQICKDADFGFIASKIELGGKIIIMSLSIPVITALIDTVTGLLS